MIFNVRDALLSRKNGNFHFFYHSRSDFFVGFESLKHLPTQHVFY